jgi:iron complex outermembrane receptor protein
MKSEHPVQKRSAQPRLLLSAISLAVLTLANRLPRKATTPT